MGQFLAIIRGEKKAPFLIKCLLGPLSLLYRNLVALRNYAYDLRVFSSMRPPIPIVSIGNITAGGTGKTPLVHLLALHLQDQLKLGILSRGYRSKIEKSRVSKAISSGSGPTCSPEECGDEPYLLAQKTRAHLFVGPDRRQSSRLAIEAGMECLLLDDGMQHRRLQRDIEIVVVDGRRSLSKEKFLPLGLLRDSPKRLKNAHCIVATHIRDATHFTTVESELSAYTKAPLIGTRLAVTNTQSFFFKKGRNILWNWPAAPFFANRA